MTWRSSPLPPGWDGIVKHVLRRDPWCMWGSAPDDGAKFPCCDLPSAEVDHFGAPNDHRLEVLRGLCRNHHAEKSLKQRVSAAAEIRHARKRPPQKHPAYRDGK
jgi:hypothetical protein